MEDHTRGCWACLGVTGIGVLGLLLVHYLRLRAFVRGVQAGNEKRYAGCRQNCLQNDLRIQGLGAAGMPRAVGHAVSRL
jgi:hypothetical protein